MKTCRGQILAYALEKYGTQPEYLWITDPSYAVLRHSDGDRWYAVIMDVPADRLGLQADGKLDIMNVRTGDPLLTDLLVKEEGVLRGWHMNKRLWISVLLDGTVPLDRVKGLLDESFRCTLPKNKKARKAAP